MQRNKNTKKIEQIEKVSKSNKEISENIYSVMKKFGLVSIFQPFNSLKRSGALVSTIGMTLIILPFVAKQSVWSFVKSELNQGEAGAKDAFYTLKNNSKIDWRSLLYGMAKRFKLLLDSSNDQAKNSIRALILDDTTVAKTGKNIERVGYVHDHVSQTFILGYKILVAGYWDGVSFIPIDFSIHREKRDGQINKVKKQIEKKRNKIKALQEKESQLNKKAKKLKQEIKELNKSLRNKVLKTKQKQLAAKTISLEKTGTRLESLKQSLKDTKQKLYDLQNTYYELEKKSAHSGLTKKEYKNQFKKHRDRNTPGYKRIKETDESKIDSAISMTKRALKKGFEFDYILTDSWFFCGKLLQVIVRSKTSAHLVSMAKIGNAKYKILPSNKFFTPAQIINLNKRKSKTNRKYKARYIKLQAQYQGVRVVIFLVSIGKGENWRLLVSTDTKISFNKLMEVYKIRWTIEVFFKEAKQHLLFGKSQSQDFDAQIADTTLSLVRYILLSYYERTHYGMSIGGLFRELSQASIEENLAADLREVFMKLLITIADIAGIDFMTVYESIIRQPELQKSLNRLNFSPNINAA